MEDGGSPYIGLVMLLLLAVSHVVLCGFLAAIDNLSESSVEKFEKEGNSKAELLRKLTEAQGGSIHTVQFLLTGLNLLAGTVWLGTFGGIKRIEMFLCYWAVIVVLGIFAPSKIAAKKAEGWCLTLCGIVNFCNKICFPFVWLLEQISNLFVRFFGVDPKENLDDVTEEEIISMVNEGHEQGVLLASEAEMIHNIFEFGDKSAKDIMTHRKNIIAVDGNMTFKEALEFITECSNSRFPVYIDDIDNIIGVLHIKEALQVSLTQDVYEKPVKEVNGLVRKVDFIPETRNINVLFKEMQAEKTHMVIVVDEYGQTAGIVAMEDILEEIVGNILDEHDEDEEMIVRQYDGSYFMNGMADFGDVAKVLEIPSEEDSYETLNGFLISKIDKIPNDTDRISVNAYGYCFKVVKVENKIIQRVFVTKLPEEVHDSVQDSSCQTDKMMIE